MEASRDQVKQQLEEALATVGTLEAETQRQAQRLDEVSSAAAPPSSPPKQGCPAA